MKTWIKTLFNLDSEPEDSRAQRDEALKLFKIADGNVRLIQGTIGVKQGMLNHYGTREARKKKYIIDKLQSELLEQTQWAVDYGNQYVKLKLKVDAESKQRNENI
tara:strand:+ start:2307 stop:2621 length:315 start_codon:yes stop_codon:yes gene_type:complete